MREEQKKKLPDWYNNTNKYGLILTDDIDSLLSCAILKSVKDWDIEQIMLFRANPSKDKDYLGEAKGIEIHEQIGVDFAMCEGKCFDNHLTKFNYDDTYNKQSINLNHINNINRNTYTKKYNLSTVLLLWSLYDLPKEGLSDELMMILLTIDSSFYSFYRDAFRNTHYKWLVDVLDLPDFYDCEKRHTEKDFIDINKKYNLKSKIAPYNGYLDTDVDIEAINEELAWYCDVKIELPKLKFRKVQEFNDRKIILEGYPSNINKVVDNPFSYALTRKNEIKVSTAIA